MLLGDTILPWLLGILLSLALLTLAVTIKSWREMKRSPYFFLRRQAEKRMQTFSLASLALLLTSTITSGYAWRAPSDDTPRVAILTIAKPPKEAIIAAVNASVPTRTEASISDLQVSVLERSAPLAESAAAAETTDSVLAQAEPAAAPLPDAFDQFEPAIALGGGTAIGELFFSTELGQNYQPVNPRRIFAEGNYTLYATFDFEEMENGMEWSWVWRYNGSVVDGGNELWGYGQQGPGYIFLNPVEGFQNGEYSLEVWVNGEMMSQSTAFMNNAAVAAGN